MSVDEKVSHASELVKLGKFDDACSLLESLHNEHPSSLLVAKSLANVLWNLDKIDDAIYYYTYALNLSPESEDASLGLFHCLLESDRDDEAFNELRRFLSVADSEEYRSILKELNNQDS
jgi:tetratricopeptide (TPR) repeat protein